MSEAFTLLLRLFAPARSVCARLLALLALLGFALGAAAQGERIKDLASIHGVRGNQLIGYGLVVGLDGTGDQTTQTPFTVQAFATMLSQLGITLPPGTSVQMKNVAAVMVTATLPPFAKPGQTIDVTVSSVGNAKSVRGGTLLMTPLKGVDGQIYAIAQGNVLVGGVGAEGAGGSRITVNHLSAGRITGGATVERSVPTSLHHGESVYFELSSTDFSTAHRVVEAINQEIEANTAVALDARVIRVRAPADSNARVSFISRIENIRVTPAQMVAKVIVNARTGSVVMNQAVTVEACAVAHGNLSVIVSTEPLVSQPNPLSKGETVHAERSIVEIHSEKAGLVVIPRSVSLGDVVKALNAVGATPQDLLSILQAMKAAGALRAELEII